MLTRPVNLVLYWLSWRHLCSLCRYGRLYRNVPVLAVCLVWWLGAIGYGLWLWGRYKKGRRSTVFRKLLPQEKGLVLAAGEDAEGAKDVGLAESESAEGAKDVGLAESEGTEGAKDVGLAESEGTEGAVDVGVATSESEEGAAGVGLAVSESARRAADLRLTAAVRADSAKETVPGGAAGTEARETRAIPEGSVKWYVKRQHFCQLFLKGKEVLLLDLQGLTGEERDFLDVKLSAISLLGKGIWRAAAGIFLAAVTLYGGWLVAESAVPYQGKLAWFLDDLRDKRTCTLKHDNIYEWGIEGILEDVRGKVGLPETLCLATSFNLHFAPDGEILTLDTMLYGFDEDGDFVDSYLISYNRAHSGKLTIYLHGTASASYDESRALDPLVEGVGAMPLQETVEEWEGEECFGILYYGSRQWYTREGIRLLDQDGGWQLPPYDRYSFSGYTISVFCPENNDLVPARYIYEHFPLESVR